MENNFGGEWTELKLDALKKYMVAYCNALKNRNYEKFYIDAFAGSGLCVTKKGIIPGSAKIALECGDFNRYIFIEKNNEFTNQLSKLSKEFPEKNIEIVNGDCNIEIEKIINRYNWTYTRALGFIDPYSTQLSYATLEKIAQTRSIDSWYLFPFSVLLRCLNKDGHISSANRNVLIKLLGTDKWETDLFKEVTQLNLFNDFQQERVDMNNICCFVKKNLGRTFPYVSCPAYLTNSLNAPMFLLFFTMSNPNERAIEIGKRISTHILNSYNQVCNH